MRKKADGPAFEKEFKEFSNDEMFYDAEDYKDEIKALMNKGLSMKSAYFALAGEDKVANIRKDLEVEIEQKLLNNFNKRNAKMPEIFGKIRALTEAEIKQREDIAAIRDDEDLDFEDQMASAVTIEKGNDIPSFLQNTNDI